MKSLNRPSASQPQLNDDHDLTTEMQLKHFFTKHSKHHHNTTPENRLCAIESFVNLCRQTTLSGFLISRSETGRLQCSPTDLGKTYFHKISLYLSYLSDSCYYSPPINLFFSVCKELNLLAHEFVHPGAINTQSVTDAELFNQLVSLIREYGSTSEYRRSVAKNDYSSFRRFCKLVTYTDALFDHVKSRLIVLRIDLKYRAEHAATMPIGQSQEDLKHFFGNMRSKPSLFSDLVGYIWKLEYSDQGSEHFHLILFFSNERLNNGCHRAEQICQYWADVVTKGRGTYFNCNRPEYMARQSRLALGRIEYYEDEKRFNLLYLLAYFCIEGQELRAKPKKRSRSLMCGEMPKARETAIGRPRLMEVKPREYLSLHPKFRLPRVA